ncbi:hypothetical protein KZZ52_45385 [Dactylosporangium sp. AC04546]|uniref:hypothetical protein n=1 Tax=Dactylosporangium sp. AC04546 TaxID=2862460 RepID=UPI001EE0288F|nr:hypothetical protein [Dactylosporangium sp. AC04546]WVK81150.1 hypothetical protein KZZ52_45385 [Dactylosporangium sp. AC04546]
MLFWRAAEVAEALSTTPIAVNSALRRARATLAPVVADDLSEPPGPPHPRGRRPLRGRLRSRRRRCPGRPSARGRRTGDAPIPTWFTDAGTVAAFHADRARPFAGRWRMLPTKATGEPALAVYVLDPGSGEFHAYGMTVLSVFAGKVSRVVVFNGPRLFARFGHPTVAAAAALAGPST